MKCNIIICKLRATFICCSLITLSLGLFAQTGIRKVLTIKSEYSELEYEDIRAIPNLRCLMAINISEGFNLENKFKIAYFNDYLFPTYKKLYFSPKYDIISACGNDSSLVALFIGSHEKKPIQIYSLRKKGFVITRKIKIKDSIISKGIDEIYFLNQNKLLLASTYNFSKREGEPDKIRLGIMDIDSKEIQASVELDFGKSILYSYFPKQWITVNSHWIVLVNPITAKLYMFDHDLNIVDSFRFNFVNVSGAEKRLNDIFTKETLIKTEYKPKFTIDLFLKNDLLNSNRIEKIFFVNNDNLLISTIQNNGYKSRRFILIYDLANKMLKDSFTVEYQKKCNGFEFRHTGGRYFTNQNVCLNIKPSYSLVKDSMFYQMRIFDYQPVLPNYVNLLNPERIVLSDDSGQVKSEAFLKQFDFIIFLDKFACSSCLKNLPSKTAIISIEHNESVRQRILFKNMFVKKYNNENIFFLENKECLNSNNISLNKAMRIIK